MKQLEPTEVLQMLDEIAKSKPEGYVYKGAERGLLDDPPICFYFEEGQPSCLIGHLLHRLGFGEVHVVEGSLISQQWGAVRDVFTPRALTLLRGAQAAQDAGCSWADAVADARRALGRELRYTESLIGGDEDASGTHA